jgi:proteasome lid subunit RPN8/RPN11
VLRIGRAVYDEIVAHARADHPDEACGLIAGREDGDLRVVRMLNAARSPTFYEMDPREQFTVFREMDDNDEELVAIYHSHTATEAYPSRTDISIAAYPEAHYVLVSTRDPVEVEFRSFRILDGVVDEEPVEIVE